MRETMAVVLNTFLKMGLLNFVEDNGLNLKKD